MSEPRVVATGLQFPEGPIAEADGSVLLVEIGITAISPDGSTVEHVALPDVLVTNICFVDDEPRAFCTLSGTGQLVEIDWPRPGLKLHFP